MSKLTKTRASQQVQALEFTFNYNDTMVSTAGSEVDFGATNLAATAFDVAALPANAVVVGGSVSTETAFDAATYTVKVGDAADDDRYLAATDLKAVGNTALTVTGYHNTASSNVRVTVTAADACTTGKMTVRVLYIVRNRAEEVTG